MGKTQKPTDAKLFLAVMYSDDSIKDEALKIFEDKFCKHKRSAGPLSVSDFTEYYSSEMGEELKKIFLTFDLNISRDELPEIKNFTNSLESRFCVDSNRLVNLDPGYITTDKLVLASTKDFYHRLYLGDGIYGEVTLHFRAGKFRFFSWTYPDYLNSDVLRVLELARADLVGEVRRKKREK